MTNHDKELSEQVKKQFGLYEEAMLNAGVTVAHLDYDLLATERMKAHERMTTIITTDRERACREARISELVWALSRLNTYGKETDSQALSRAVNELDDNIEILRVEVATLSTQEGGKDE